MYLFRLIKNSVRLIYQEKTFFEQFIHSNVNFLTVFFFHYQD